MKAQPHFKGRSRALKSDGALHTEEQRWIHLVGQQLTGFENVICLKF